MAIARLSKGSKKGVSLDMKLRLYDFITNPLNKRVEKQEKMGKNIEVTPVDEIIEDVKPISEFIDKDRLFNPSKFNDIIEKNIKKSIPLDEINIVKTNEEEIYEPKHSKECVKHDVNRDLNDYINELEEKVDKLEKQIERYNKLIDKL